MFELRKCCATLASDGIDCNPIDKSHIKDKIFPLTIIAVPILENNTYVTSMEYSPLIGGFAITLNDGRAAYLTANSLKFDPNVSELKRNSGQLMCDVFASIFVASAGHLGARIGGRNVCQHQSQISIDRVRTKEVSIEWKSSRVDRI